MFKKNFTLFTFIILAVILIMSFVYKQNNITLIDNSKIPTVTMGIQASPALALPMVAKDMKYFEKNGIDVEIKDFAAGKDALTAFLSGSLDYSVSGEVPVGLAIANQNQKFTVPAQIVTKTTNEVRIVATKDGDIADPREYFLKKKRKLATSIGGGPEYYTSEFLKKNNIQKDQVEIVAQKPSDMVSALVSGSVDAISIFDPIAYIAQQKLGEKALVFKDSQLYSELYVLSSKLETEEKKLNTQKIIKALIEAEKYIQTNPKESKIIVAKYTKLDLGVLDGIWDNFDFRVGITRQLEGYLNSQFDWAKENNKISIDTPKPQYSNYINTELLSKIDASKVEISK
jgi:ABC-type nitrate/sulfonate/bicarbonate transport system substrate-binding protein